MFFHRCSFQRTGPGVADSGRYVQGNARYTVPAASAGDLALIACQAVGKRASGTARPAERLTGRDFCHVWTLLHWWRAVGDLSVKPAKAIVFGIFVALEALKPKAGNGLNDGARQRHTLL